MRKLSLSLIALSLPLTMTGCAFIMEVMDGIFGRPKGGGPSPAEIAANVTAGIPVWGQIVGGIVTLGTLAFGGHKVVKHIKKKRDLRAGIRAR